MGQPLCTRQCIHWLRLLSHQRHSLGFLLPPMCSSQTPRSQGTTMQSQGTTELVGKGSLLRSPKRQSRAKDRYCGVPRGRVAAILETLASRPTGRARTSGLEFKPRSTCHSSPSSSRLQSRLGWRRQCVATVRHFATHKETETVAQRRRNPTSKQRRHTPPRPWRPWGDLERHFSNTYRRWRHPILAASRRQLQTPR